MTVLTIVRLTVSYPALAIVTLVTSVLHDPRNPFVGSDVNDISMFTNLLVLLEGICDWNLNYLQQVRLLRESFECKVQEVTCESERSASS